MLKEITIGKATFKINYNKTLENDIADADGQKFNVGKKIVEIEDIKVIVNGKQIANGSIQEVKNDPKATHCIENVMLPKYVADQIITILTEMKATYETAEIAEFEAEAEKIATANAKSDIEFYKAQAVVNAMMNQ